MNTVLDNGALLTLALVGVVAAGGVAKRGVGSMARSTGRSVLLVSRMNDPYEKARPGWYITNTESGAQVAGPFQTEASAHQRLSDLEGRVRSLANRGSMSGIKESPFQALSTLPKGAFFKRKPDAKKVYRKGDYDRSSRTYAGLDTDDISRSIPLKGATQVYVNFEY